MTLNKDWRMTWKLQQTQPDMEKDPFGNGLESMLSSQQFYTQEHSSSIENTKITAQMTLDLLPQQHSQVYTKY